MKNEKWMVPAAAGAALGVAAVAYGLLSRDIPKGATPVEPFDIKKFMGKWHEIARLPLRIEKNLKDLTEDYAMEANGDITVVTEAFNVKKHKLIKAAGKMKFAGREGVGMLKVSYFGPFYLAYNVLAVDPDYRYTLVAGSSTDYLWLLSRETTIPDEIKKQFLTIALQAGFPVEKLEWM